MEDPRCDISGRCVAPAGVSGITNCVDCGKELIEREGQWYTWDADLVTDEPTPQGRE